MQYINLTNNVLIFKQKEALLYQTVHENNARYLEREDEPERFEVLWNVDDASGTFIREPDQILKLMRDLEIVLKEAQGNNDYEMCNHLKEIFVLCKIFLWNKGKFQLNLDPWGYAPSNYPDDLPEKYKYNISALG